MNFAIIRGTLSSAPRTRVLPSGTTMMSYEITTTEVDGTRCSIPVVWFDPSRPPGVEAGDEVVAVGRVRRRFFRVGGSSQSRTEVEASVVVRPGSPRATRAAESCVGGLLDLVND